MVKEFPEALEYVYKSLLRKLRTWRVNLLPKTVVTKAKAEGGFIGEGTFGKCYRVSSADGTSLCVKIMKSQQLEHCWRTLSNEVK